MITVQLFKDVGFDIEGGFRTIFFPHSGGRFLARDVEFFRSEGLQDKISSIKVISHSGEDSQAVAYVFRDKRFRGDFLAFRADLGVPQEEENLRNRNFDNKASSLLVIRRHTNECVFPLDLTVQLAPVIRGIINARLDSLRGDERIESASQRKRPEISWEVFPDFAPSEQLLRVTAFLKIEPNIYLLRNRNVRIVFWFSLIPASDGTLTAFLVQCEAHADRGFFTRARLEEIVKRWIDDTRDEVVGSVKAVLRSATEAFPRLNYRIVDSYLMPAMAMPTSSSTASFSGNLDASRIFVFYATDRPFAL